MPSDVTQKFKAEVVERNGDILPFEFGLARYRQPCRIRLRHSLKSVSSESGVVQ
jgi:hypothetical protein